jgi:type VI secretion system protein ImpF
MDDNPNTQPLVPSLLDRLLDDDPGGPPPPPAAGYQLLRDLKQSVCRDLENLLNTRTRFLAWGPHLRELDQSLLAYGLPDFNSVNLASEADRLRFCRVIEGVIRDNEPRLIEVRVLPRSEGEPDDRVLRFRIEALLRVEPAPEQVAFDSLVKPTTGNVEVKRATR